MVGAARRPPIRAFAEFADRWTASGARLVRAGGRRRLVWIAASGRLSGAGRRGVLVGGGALTLAGAIGPPEFDERAPRRRRGRRLAVVVFLAAAVILAARVAPSAPPRAVPLASPADPGRLSSASRGIGPRSSGCWSTTTASARCSISSRRPPAPFLRLSAAAAAALVGLLLRRGAAASSSCCCSAVGTALTFDYLGPCSWRPGVRIGEVGDAALRGYFVDRRPGDPPTSSSVPGRTVSAHAAVAGKTAIVTGAATGIGPPPRSCSPRAARAWSRRGCSRSALSETVAGIAAAGGRRSRSTPTSPTRGRSTRWPRARRRPTAPTPRQQRRDLPARAVA